MRNILTALLFFISVSLFSQDEKRLALVIGNANYDKGELKNPVNDARLIASTLDSLDFDVILKENLATKRDMTAAIREFGSKRSDYDVAFVYYAGHGIQVDDENFLLPTKEVFEEEFDVMDYGVSVQNIMRYLRAQTNEVNILILDACRDNPFESNWNTTRSLKGGGLAKIPPPTGSLIAFSTDSGQTAPDGDGDNSVYTISLAKNMLLEDTSIDQVFRNVRAEVLSETGGMQRPVEATQLTGQTFYFKKRSISSYEKEFLTNLNNGNYKGARRTVNEILDNYKNSHIPWLLDGHLLNIENKLEEATESYEKSLNIKITSNALFSFIGDESLEVGIIPTIDSRYFNIDSTALQLTKLYDDYLNKKNYSIDDLIIYAEITRDLNDYDLSNKHYEAYLSALNSENKSIKTKIRGKELTISKSKDIESIDKYANHVRLDVYALTQLAFNAGFYGDYNKALEYINKAIKIYDDNNTFVTDKNKTLFWYKSEILINLGLYEKAKLILNELINIEGEDVDVLFLLARISVFQEKYDEAVEYVNKIRMLPENIPKEEDKNFEMFRMYLYSAVVNYISGNYIESYTFATTADLTYPDIWFTPFIRALSLSKLNYNKILCSDLSIKEFIKGNGPKYIMEENTFSDQLFGDYNYWKNEVKNLLDYYNSSCNN